MKILIIDDEEGIVTFLAKGLRSRGYSVDTAGDGERGSLLAKNSAYDLVVLDYNLPKLDGLSVLKDIRAEGLRTPVLTLTVHGDPDKKKAMFQEGADDYLTKPFLFEEFIWRVEALLRRPALISHKTWRLGPLALDTKSQLALRNGRRIYLTSKEYCLLELFFRRQDEVLSRSQIMDSVWESNADPFSNTIEAHIMSLRKKLNIHGERDFIHTIPGRGYRFSLSRY
ncbi:MAG: response regulator transcription factor [Bacillota bacterium]